MTIYLPPRETKQWKQTNSGDVFGTLYSTRNIDFDQEGYLKLAKRPTAIVYDVTNFSSVTSITTTALGASTYYIMTSGRPHSLVFNLSVTDIYTSSIGDGNIRYDIVPWQSVLYASQDTKFSYYNGVGWTGNLGSLTAGKQHPLCVFESANQLAIGDGNTVKLYDTAHSLFATATIPADFEVYWIRYNAGNLYIGTKNLAGGNAIMYVWNGSGTAPQGSYPIEGTFMFSGCNFNNSIAIITSRGRLMLFNGGGFTELANLPVYYTGYSWYGNTPTAGKVVNRGMISEGGIIYINLDGGLADSSVRLPNQPSGLWVYDPKVGLYHRAGYATTKTESRSIDNTTGINTTTNVITVSSYTAQTGTKVLYTCSDGGAAGGLNQRQFYYIIRVSATELKLALTYDDAIAGTAIDLTSQGTTQVLYFHNDDDFGQVTGITPGAIGLTSDYDTFESPLYRSMNGSRVLYGAFIPNDTLSSGVYTLQTLTEGENRGNFVTQKIQSSAIKDTWKKIYSKLNYLFEGNDKVIVKYRTEDRYNFPIYPFPAAKAVTWVDASSFTTPSDLSGVVVGDEVEILSGSGAGYTAHITAIQQGSPDWIVTLDETVSVSTNDLSYVFIQNWKKIGVANSETQDLILETLCGEKSKWIQVKVELRGVSQPTIEEMQIINSAYKPSE